MEKENSHIKELIFVLVATLFLGGGFFMAEAKEKKQSEILKEVQAEKIAKENIARLAFENIKLEARGVYIYNIDSGDVVFSKNENNVFGIASLTKIITSLVALDELSLVEPIIISKGAAETEGETGLKEGELWFRDDLLELMLIASSNDAGIAIQEEINREGKDLVSLMNEKTSSLGLSDLKFKNPTGLDEGDSISATGTPKGVARMLGFAYKENPDFFKKTAKEVFSKRNLDGKLNRILNTNPILSSDTEMKILASKTGYTSLAGGSLALIVESEKGERLAIAILGSSFDGRFKDAENLIRASAGYLLNF